MVSTEITIMIVVVALHFLVILCVCYRSFTSLFSKRSGNHRSSHCARTVSTDGLPSHNSTDSQADQNTEIQIYEEPKVSTEYKNYVFRMFEQPDNQNGGLPPIEQNGGSVDTCVWQNGRLGPDPRVAVSAVYEYCGVPLYDELTVSCIYQNCGTYDSHIYQNGGLPTTNEQSTVSSVDQNGGSSGANVCQNGGPPKDERPTVSPIYVNCGVSIYNEPTVFSIYKNCGR